MARSLGVTAAEVSRRLKKADYAVAGALKSDGCDGKDLEIKHLQSKVGELTMLIELKDEKIERLETGRPFVRLEVKAMSLVVSTSEKKPYGVKRVCEAWRMSSSTVHRHLKEASETSGDRPPRRRPGPVGAMPDANLTEAIEQVVEGSPFHGEGYRKVHARLAHTRGYAHRGCGSCGSCERTVCSPSPAGGRPMARVLMTEPSSPSISR